MSEKHTETPRTDAEVERRRLLRYHGTPEKEPKVGADFARQLESELDEARVKLDQWPTKYAQAMDLWTDDNVRNNETITQLRAVAEGLAEHIRYMANMPEYDQDDAHRLRHIAKRSEALAAYEAWKGGAKQVPTMCQECYGSGYEEIDHGHYPCPRGYKPSTPQPIAKCEETWICTDCHEKVSDISPLGPPGVIICEDCANPKRAKPRTLEYMIERTPQTEQEQQSGSSKPNILDRMAKQVGAMLCVSPETGSKLGIWSVSHEGAIGLGTQDGSEFWILESILHESTEIEVKGLPTRKDWQSTAEQMEYYRKSMASDARYLQGALLILKENGIAVGSTELIAAADRAGENITYAQPEQQQQESGDFQTGHIGWSPDYKSQPDVPLKKFACDVPLSSQLIRMADAQRKLPQPEMIPLADVLPLLSECKRLATSPNSFPENMGLAVLMEEFEAKHQEVKL